MTSGPVCLFLLVACFFSLYIVTLQRRRLGLVLLLPRGDGWPLRHSGDRCVTEQTSMTSSAVPDISSGWSEFFFLGFPLTVQGTFPPRFPNSQALRMYLCFALVCKEEYIIFSAGSSVATPDKFWIITTNVYQHGRRLNSREHISVARQESINFTLHPLHLSPYLHLIFQPCLIQRWGKKNLILKQQQHDE